MKFTVLSHAGLLVESDGVRLMQDPWIVGSCYWRSWWNYPPASAEARLEELEYIYISHMHWDHFHGPSLRKLPRSATLLIPEMPFGRMRKDAELFRFKEIVELPHAKTMQLEGNLRVTSYQYGLFHDSVLAVSDGTTTLLNMNDCKILGRPLAQIVRNHPQVDFVFRSHSSATSYPHCVTHEDPDALVYRSDDDYMRDFTRAASVVDARFAIPFASAHCFLHKETYRFNDTVVSPEETRRYFDQHPPERASCVVMVAGDSWDDESGFQIRQHDYFSNKDARLAEYAKRIEPTLEAHYAAEDGVELSFEAFRKFFEAQLASVPRISRLIFRPIVLFGFPNRPDVNWVIDFDRREVYEQGELPADYAFRVVIHPAVLKDCIYKRMFAVFTASKRLSVEIRKDHTKDLLIFFPLLDLLEYDYLPLRRLLSWRFIKAWGRRWREMLLYLGLLSSVILRRRGDDPLAKFMPRI